jgi:hypothetical protein
MLFVQLLLLGVNLRSSFDQGCQAIAQRARAAGAAGAAPCQHASVQAGLAPVMAQSMHQQNTILDRV